MIAPQHLAAVAPRHGALPNLVMIGAMKAGTSALHRYLDRHPQIAMSEPKELNFFFDQADRSGGDEPPMSDGHDAAERRTWSSGNWHRGTTWYTHHFLAESPVRGESSPGYTSPDHPGVAARMAAVIPTTRLVYLVRDPIERAISQYRHHRTEGDELRPLEDALFDPASQYVARSRYHERLEPFLEHFARGRLLIVCGEELLAERRATLQSIFAFVGVDQTFWCSDLRHRWHTAAGDAPRLGQRLPDRLAEMLRDDAERLRALAGREFPGWSV